MNRLEQEVLYLRRRVKELALEKDEAYALATYWRDRYREKQAHTESGRDRWLVFSAEERGVKGLSRAQSSLQFALARLRDNHVRMLLMEDDDLVTREELEARIQELEQENESLRRRLYTTEHEEQDVEQKVMQLEYLLKQGAKDYERIQNQLKATREQVSSRDSQIVELRREELSLHEQVRELEQELEDIKIRSTERIMELRQELDKKEVSLDNLSDEVERIRADLLAAIEERDETKQALEQARLRIATLEEERDELLQSNETLREMLDLLEENVAQLESNLDTGSMAGRKDVLKVLDELVEYIDNSLEAVSKYRDSESRHLVIEGDDELRAALERVEQKFEHQARKVMQLQERLEARERELDEARERLYELENSEEKERLASIEKELEKYRRMSERTMDDTSKLLEKLRAKEQEFMRLQEEYDITRSHLEELEQLIEERDAENRKLETEIDKLKKQIPAGESMPKGMAEKLIARLETLEDELLSLEDSIVLEVERVGRFPLELDTIAHGVEQLVPINPQRVYELEREVMTRRKQTEELNVRLGKCEGELLVLRAKTGKLRESISSLEEVARNLELLGIMKAAMDIKEAITSIRDLV